MHDCAGFCCIEPADAIVTVAIGDLDVGRVKIAGAELLLKSLPSVDNILGQPQFGEVQLIGSVDKFVDSIELLRHIVMKTEPDFALTKKFIGIIYEARTVLFLVFENFVLAQSRKCRVVLAPKPRIIK